MLADFPRARCPSPCDQHRRRGAAISLVNVHTGNAPGLYVAFVNRINNAASAADVGFVNIADNGFLPIFPIFSLAKP